MSKVDVSELQGPLTELLQQLSGENGRERFREFKLWLKRVADNSLKELLAQREAQTVGPVAFFNPSDFFTTREGLWVSDQAKDLFLSAASEKVSLDDEVTLQSFMLTEPANDVGIREVLPENHVFETDDLCAVLKSLLDAQWGGKAGILDEKDYNWNLFYVKGKNGQLYVVGVGWCADDRRWFVSAWSLDDSRWSAGYRVFSRNC